VVDEDGKRGRDVRPFLFVIVSSVGMTDCLILFLYKNVPLFERGYGKSEGISIRHSERSEAS